MTVALVIGLALWQVARRIGRAIDRAEADAALRNLVALAVDPVGDCEIADNLDG